MKNKPVNPESGLTLRHLDISQLVRDSSWRESLLLETPGLYRNAGQDYLLLLPDEVDEFPDQGNV